MPATIPFELLAVTYAGNELSKMPDHISTEERLFQLLRTYIEAREKLPMLAAQALPAQQAGVF